MSCNVLWCDVAVMWSDVMRFFLLCHVTSCNVLSCDALPCDSLSQMKRPAQCYSVLQSTTPVLLCTTKYYSSTTLYYTVLQRTTPVLPYTTKYYSSTTLYCKVLLQYYSVLQSTTPVLLCSTQYYNVLLQYYSVLQSSIHDWSLTHMNRHLHDWCPSHMKRHLQRAEQQESQSNFTKYCACHAKWISCLIRVSHETSFTMSGATGITIQLHQILHLPRKMNLMIDPRHIWNVT